MPGTICTTISSLVAHPIIRMAAGSTTFLSVKLVWVRANEVYEILPHYQSYVLVHVVLLLLGWLFHSLVSFRRPLGQASFLRYVKTASVFNVCDILSFSLLVHVVGTPPVFAVLLFSAVRFLLRFAVYSRFVFT